MVPYMTMMMCLTINRAILIVMTHVIMRNGVLGMIRGEGETSSGPYRSDVTDGGTVFAGGGQVFG